MDKKSKKFFFFFKQKTAYEMRISDWSSDVCSSDLYGWVVAAVTFLTMMVGACAVGAPGVLIGPLQAEFGWDVADISAAFAVRLALFGLVGPFAAVLINPFGVRLIALVALGLIGLGVLCSFALTGLGYLFLACGLFF